jgi:hypothetical protein
MICERTISANLRDLAENLKAAPNKLPQEETAGSADGQRKTEKKRFRKDYQRQYRLKNRSRIIKTERQWRKNHPENIARIKLSYREKNQKKCSDAQRFGAGPCATQTSQPRQRNRKRQRRLAPALG